MVGVNVHDLRRMLTKAEKDLEKDREALRQIDALHTQDGAGGYCVVDGFCVGCGQVWPCPTNEIIDAARKAGAGDGGEG